MVWLGLFEKMQHGLSSSVLGNLLAASISHSIEVSEGDLYGECGGVTRSGEAQGNVGGDAQRLVVLLESSYRVYNSLHNYVHTSSVTTTT